jgi:acetyl-CoA acetyltransferase
LSGADQNEVRALLGRAAIAGLGITDLGKVYGRTASDFAADAGRRAVADAGLSLRDVDGLLISNGASGSIDLRLQRELGLRDLKVLSQVVSYGATATGMLQFAGLAVASGMASTVLCVHGDAPLQPAKSSGEVYKRAPSQPKGFGGLVMAAGMRSPNTGYALAARRHMQRYGTTSEQFGSIAVAQRAWATMNPLARFREPITLEDHQHSRIVADPLHLLDCCMVSNGGIAVVVTTADHARSLAKPPVYMWGAAQTHPGDHARGSMFGLVSGAAIAGPRAMEMAGVRPSDIDVREIYDCYTYTCLITLEDYGFCEKGEGGALAESGALGPGGALPTNTGGGQLSAYYLWGMTPLSEAVIQVRGEGGERQVPRHDVAVVSGNGGILDHHGCLVLGSRPRG